MDKIKMLMLLCFVLVLAMLVGQADLLQVHAATKEILVLSDSYTDESNPAENYGSMGHLLIKGAVASNSYGFLQFETFNIKPGDYRIELRLYCNTIYPEGVTEADINIYSTDDTPWSEGKINYNNKPKVGSEIGKGRVVKGQYISFDVSSYVMDARMRKKPVSFAIIDAKNTGRAIVLSSKQNGKAELSPTLVVDTAKKPQPIPAPSVTPTPTLALTPTPTGGIPSNTPAPTPTPVVKLQEQPAKVDIDASIHIDDYTTTRYAPWMVNLHLTSPQQVKHQKKGGEAAQMVWAMGVSQSNPKVLLLGTDTAGIYKSTDAGKTWRISNNGFGMMGTVDIAFHPDDENIAYVLASPNNDAGSTFQPPPAGVWKSTDGGGSWRQILKAPYFRKGSNKLIRFGNPDRFGRRKIFVGTHAKGLYVSSDDGESWENKGLIGELLHDINYDAENSKLLVACEKSGLMVSEDDGNSWKSKNEGLPAKKVLSIAINPTDNKHWLIICDNKIFESMDSGSSWKDLEASHKGMYTSNSFQKLLFGAPNEDGKARLYLAISNTQYSFRYSEDYGKTFQNPIVHNELAFIQDNWGWFAEPFAVHPTDPYTVWTPLDTELFKSTDKEMNMHPSGSGFSGFRASNFLFDKNNDKNIMITFIDRGLVRSVDYGGNEKYSMFEYLMEDRYNPRYKGQKTVGAIDRDPQNPNHLFISVGDWGANKTLAESTDGGLNFTKIPDTEGSPLIIKYHPQDSSIIYAGKNMSTDGGKTWSKVSYNIAAVSPFNGDVIWGRSGDLVYKSLNRGKDWQPLNLKISGVQGMKPDIFVEDRLWIGSFASGLYRVDGEMVTRIFESNGLVKTASGALPIYDVAQDPKNEKHLVAGGTDNQGYSPSAGLFETYDGGQTWRVVDGMEGSKDIWKVAFHPNLPQVYIATSNGTWVYEYDKYFDRTKMMFHDIESHWAKQSIEELSKVGIIKGYDDGSFKPDANITRAEFTQILVKALKLESSSNSVLTFADVYPDDWYFGSIETAVKQGYIAGADLGKFLPNENITHEQISVIIARVLKQNNMILKNTPIANEFQNLSDWAKDAAATCFENDIISLSGDGAFVPKRAATRAEAAVMLDKLLKKLSMTD